MIETWGEGNNTILDHEDRGTRGFLKRTGWSQIDSGYNYLNIKGNFWGSLFKERLFTITFKKEDNQIILTYKDQDKVGQEYKYKVIMNGLESDWVDIKDFNDDFRQLRRDTILGGLL